MRENETHAKFLGLGPGVLPVSAAIGEEEIDGFVAALERALHTVGYVS